MEGRPAYYLIPFVPIVNHEHVLLGPAWMGLPSLDVTIHRAEQSTRHQPPRTRTCTCTCKPNHPSPTSTTEVFISSIIHHHHPSPHPSARSVSKPKQPTDPSILHPLRPPRITNIVTSPSPSITTCTHERKPEPQTLTSQQRRPN